MKSVKSSLRASFDALGRGLRVPGLYLTLLFAVALWCAAYQQKSVYSVAVGGPLDDAYVSGFNSKEHNTDLSYRWSGPRADVTFPGIGSEPVYVSITSIGYRPSGAPPTVTLSLRGQTFAFTAQQQAHTDTFFVERGPDRSGDTNVTISATTFSPPGDPRRLGVIVSNVSIAPAAYGLSPVVIPPVGTILAMVLFLVGLYVTALLTVRRTTVAITALWVPVIVGAVLILTARPDLGLLARDLAPLTLWAVATGFASRLLLDVWRLPDFAASLGSSAASMAFLLRFGGVIFPQFLTSDILLHVHNTQAVLGGQWVFTEPLPDGTPVPYPNALYLLLAPFAALVGPSDANITWLLKLSASLFDGAVCLPVAWAASRAWGGRAGGYAALIYAFSPAVFALFSPGNYTNLFAQAVFTATLLGAFVYLGETFFRSPRSSAVPILLASGLALTMLGHYGMMLAALGVAAIFGALTLFSTLRGHETRRSRRVLLAFGGALLSAVAAYYWRFADLIWNQWSAVFSRVVGTHPSGGRAAKVDTGWRDFVAKRLPLVGPVLVVPAAAGGILSLRRTTRIPGESGALLLAWIGAALVFAALDKAVGDTVRWSYLSAAPVALLSGRFLGAISHRGRDGRLLGALVLAYLLVSTLLFWVGELIYTHYH